MNNIYKCPRCGSEKIKIIHTEERNGETVDVWRCAACDAEFTPSVPSAPATPVLPDLFAACRRRVVRIECEDGDTVSFGTGTVVSARGYVLTNAHVVADLNAARTAVERFCDTVRLSGFGSLPAEADVVFVDAAADLALLYADTLSAEPVTLADRPAQTGQSVYTIGNSKGEGLCLLEGIVSDTARRVHNRTLDMISVPVTAGNSGGPIFAADGTCLGVVCSGRADAPAMNYMIPASALRAFLATASAREGLEL